MPHITHATIRNFKTFEDVSLDLEPVTVLVGPNNCGKTSFLQALTLWQAGVSRWAEVRGEQAVFMRKVGVTINRRDLFSIPAPTTSELWRGLKSRVFTPKQTPVMLDIILKGNTQEPGKVPWDWGMQFYYANPESFYCRPIKKKTEKEFPPLPPEAEALRFHFLQTMSGIASAEPRVEQGRIDVLIGEGRTAEVLRNLCLQVHNQNPEKWEMLQERMEAMFGVMPNTPGYIPSRGEITLSCKNRGGTNLDISSQGRGFQQVLLLLAYMYSHPKGVLLLDEPDAHLETLRQREVFQTLTEEAVRQGVQLLCASHSEVVLNEAANKHGVASFIGAPHLIIDTQQLLKALRDYGFQHYLQAKQRGWVLYLEGTTDLDILRHFAKKLRHAAEKYLERPFLHGVANHVPEVANHFYAMREAVPGLKGIALFDRLEDKPLPEDKSIAYLMWEKREIENYLCTKSTLIAWAAQNEKEPNLFSRSPAIEMKACIEKVVHAMNITGKPSPWSDDCKVSDEFLPPLFTNYKECTYLPVLQKGDFWQLVEHIPEADWQQTHAEITEKLDAILRIAEAAERKVKAES